MSDTVQKIKEQLNIVDVISPYVDLHKAGKNFKGKSPFSVEKTPSFYVSPDRGMYYCFSTSQGGDIFNFIQAMEGVDFKGALKILAEKAGVELIPEDPKKRSERDRLYEALEVATEFYSIKLKEEDEAKEYLKDRGVKDDTIAKWRIGYAPGPPKGGWRESKDFLEDRGFSKEDILKAGIIKNAEGGKEPFDVFRDRIMFPMSDSSGRIVAFSGRILHNDDKAPKYVNSPETELYKKSELLFGYDKAKHGIRTLEFSLIVEGQFDVVMCHQAGYANTVAVSGTALTLYHVQQLERMSDRVVLALDADKAGINAMKKGAELMLGRGLDVKIAELPDGQDPADIIKDKPAEFKKLIGKSVHVIEFLLHVLKRNTKDERTLKLKVREEVLPFILLLPSRIDQEHFVSKVAEFIESTTEAVRFELNHLREQRETAPIRENSSHNTYTENITNGKVSKDDGYKAYLFLLASAMVVEESMKKIIEKQLEDIVKILQPPTPLQSDLAGIVFSLEQQFGNLPKLAVKEEIINKLNRLRVTLARVRLAELKKQLVEFDENKDEENLQKVLSQITKYEMKLREPAYSIELFGQKD